MRPTESNIAVAVFVEMIKTRACFIERWNVTPINPPHHEMLLFHQREPFGAFAVELLVNGIPDKPFEAFSIAPDAHIDSHLRIGERADAGCIAGGILEAQDKAIGPVRDLIDTVEIVHELGQTRVVGRISETSDVELRQMHDLFLPSSLCSRNRSRLLDPLIAVDPPLERQ